MATPSIDGNGGPPDSFPLKDGLDYAWNWFQYHAGQRLLAFNFLLILMGALSVGYYQAYSSGAHAYAAIVALVGVVVALAFFILEIRNEELVNVGRNALKSIEMLPEFAALPPELKLLTLDRERFVLLSHKVWLRIIEGLLLLIFLFAAVMSINMLKKSVGKNSHRTGAIQQMPYINQERRDAILAGAEPQDAGELNFAITVIVDKYLQTKGKLRYAHLNEVIGVMESAKLELYRRLAAPYEDTKVKEAGDVYKSNKSGTSNTQG